MSEGEKPKIIIDEDWKSQVEAEKAAAKAPPAQQHSGEPGASATGATGESPGADATGSPYAGDDPDMPPASYEMLLTTLATEAMMALGQMPHPMTGEPQPPRRNQAKYLIDTIEVLREKTKGNLSPEEAEATEGLLHQLRMVFVSTK